MKNMKSFNEVGQHQQTSFLLNRNENFIIFFSKWEIEFLDEKETYRFQEFFPSLKASLRYCLLSSFRTKKVTRLYKDLNRTLYDLTFTWKLKVLFSNYEISLGTKIIKGWRSKQVLQFFGSDRFKLNSIYFRSGARKGWA